MQQTKYVVVFNSTTGELRSTHTANGDMSYVNIPEGYEAMETEPRSSIDNTTEFVNVTTKLLVPKPPAVEIDYGAKPAKWRNIKRIRDEMEQVPMQTSEGLFDADDASIERLTRADEYLVFLPSAAVGKGNGKVQWKRADNTFVELNAAMLKNLTKELKKEKAIRSDLLHTKAEELRSMDPAPTLDFISNINNWTD